MCIRDRGDNVEIYQPAEKVLFCHKWCSYEAWEIRGLQKVFSTKRVYMNKDDKLVVCFGETNAAGATVASIANLFIRN